MTAAQETLQRASSPREAGTARVVLGRRLELSGDEAGARAAYASPSVSRSPLRDYAYVWMAKLEERAGDPEKALGWWKRAYAVKEAPTFRLQAARVLMEDARARNAPSEEIQYARVLNEADPTDVPIALRLAELCEDSGLEGKARALVFDAWSRFPEHRALEAFFTSRPRWRAEVRSAPNDAKVRRLRALARAGDRRTLAHELGRFYPRTEAERGWKTFLKGRLAQVRRRYRTAFRLYESVRDPAEASMAAVVRMGYLAASGHAGRRNAARAEQAVMNLPLGYKGRTRSLLALSRWRNKRGDTDRALELARAVILTGHPNRQADAILYEAAWNFWMGGERRRAEALWKTLVDLLPAHADDRHAAAYCLLRFGLISDSPTRLNLLSEVLREDAYGYFGYRLRKTFPGGGGAPKEPPTAQPLPAGGHADKAHLLAGAGLPLDAARELRFVASVDPGLLWEVVRALEEEGHYRRAVLSARRLYPRAYASEGEEVPPEAWRILFPLPYRNEVRAASASAGVPTLLTASVIRQESLWETSARSRAGARGLMQLMRRTARHVARRATVPAPTTRRLHDPAWNTKVGCAYLAQLLDRYDGCLPLALAAYNAGPGRVDAWLKRPGNPTAPDLFIESIPFRETRSYVRRILLNFWEYKRIYPSLSGSPPGSSKVRACYSP